MTIMVNHDQEALFNDPAELDRRAEIAIDQGISTPFIEHERATADEPRTDIELTGLADSIRSAVDAHKKTVRSYSSQFERGTPSGRDVSLAIAKAEDAATPPPTKEERLEHMNIAVKARMNARRATADQKYQELLDSARNQDGTLDQHQIDAIIEKRRQAEAERIAARDAKKERLQAG